MHHYAKIFTIFVTAVFASEYNVEINDATQFKTMSNEDLLCMCNTQGVYRLQDVESLCIQFQEKFFFSINVHIITIRNIQNSFSPSQLSVRRSKGPFKVSHKNRLFNNSGGIFWIVYIQMTQYMHIIHYRDSQLINKSCLRWKNRNFLT